MKNQELLVVAYGLFVSLGIDFGEDDKRQTESLDEYTYVDGIVADCRTHRAVGGDHNFVREYGQRRLG